MDNLDILNNLTKKPKKENESDKGLEYKDSIFGNGTSGLDLDMNNAYKNVIESEKQEDIENIIPEVKQEEIQEKTGYTMDKDNIIQDEKESSTDVSKDSVFFLEFSMNNEVFKTFFNVMKKLQTKISTLAVLTVNAANGIRIQTMEQSGAVFLDVQIAKSNFNTFNFNGENDLTEIQLKLDIDELINSLSNRNKINTHETKFITSSTDNVLLVMYRAGKNTITKKFELHEVDDTDVSDIGSKAMSIPLSTEYVFRTQELFTDFKESYDEIHFPSKSQKHIILESYMKDKTDKPYLTFFCGLVDNDKLKAKTTIDTLFQSTLTNNETAESSYDFEFLSVMLFPFHIKTIDKNLKEFKLEYSSDSPIRISYEFFSNFNVMILSAPLELGDDDDDD